MKEDILQEFSYEPLTQEDNAYLRRLLSLEHFKYSKRGGGEENAQQYYTLWQVFAYRYYSIGRRIFPVPHKFHQEPSKSESIILMNLENIYIEVKKEIPAINHDWFSDVYFGFISFIMGNIPHACERFQASLSRDSSNAEIQSFLGYIHFKEGKYFDARISLEHSIEIDPYFYGNYLLLIVCYRKLNQSELIIEITEKGLAHFPQDWCLLMELAHVLAVLERTGHIYETLKTAISSLSKFLPEGKKKRKYYKKLDLI